MFKIIDDPNDNFWQVVHPDGKQRSLNRTSYTEGEVVAYVDGYRSAILDQVSNLIEGKDKEFAHIVFQAVAHYLGHSFQRYRQMKDDK